MNLEMLIRKGRVRGLPDENILNGIRFHYDVYIEFIQNKKIQFRVFGGHWLSSKSPLFHEGTEYRIKPVEEKTNDDWAAIPAHINYISKGRRNGFGGWWGFTYEPEYCETGGYWRIGDDAIWPLYRSDLPEWMHEADGLLVRPQTLSLPNRK